MAAFEVTSRAPGGAVRFLRKIAEAGCPIEAVNTSAKSRAWLRGHDLMSCQRESSVRGARGEFGVNRVFYDITDEGRRFLAAQDKPESPQP